MQSTMGYNKEVFEEIEFLKKENARLRRLLKKHGISPDELIENTIIQSQSASHPTSILSLDEKVALFRDIFSGREDIFARRWYSPSTGKSGYQPVCMMVKKRLAHIMHIE